MHEFKPVLLTDRTWMQPLIEKENSKSADFSFMNIFAWGETFDACVAEICGCAVVRSVIDGKLVYSFPIGADSPEQVAEVLKTLFELTRSSGELLRMQSITSEKLPLIEKHFPCAYKLTPQTDLFDYVYEAEKLITLAGNKLHAKRNFVNRFIAENNWSFSAASSESIRECMEMDGVWVGTHNGQNEDNDSFRGEMLALKLALQNFEYLQLDGGILRVNGSAVGITIGERLCSDTYVVHFEKALPEIRGTYPMINREFVRSIVEKYPEIKYINREDDMGLENLRKAKHSYYPDFMVEKYEAVEV